MRAREMDEMVLAVVQPAPGVVADAALAEELRAFARRELGGVEPPNRVDFVTDLPREPTGKLVKRKLPDRYVT
ncbi:MULTISPECIES: AMP-binding enzyme [Sphingomonas]|nr:MULTISPECIES: hypothetical protein [Sphingomonas]